MFETGRAQCGAILALGLGVASLGAVLVPAVARADAEVVFVRPEDFRDADMRHGDPALSEALLSIRRYIERLAASRLGPRYRLRVEVLEVDLAGKTEPWRSSAYDLRVMRGDTWPTIVLRYRLTEGSRVVLARDETLTDLMYLTGPAARASDPRRFEKALLDDWFRARFSAYAPPQG